MKKLFYTLGALLLMASCTDDYKDWASPQVVNQPTVASFGNGSVASVSAIDLNTIAEGQDSVQVCTITAPAVSNSAYSPVYVISFGDKVFELDQQGRMAVADLQQYLSDNYGRNPNITRTLMATVQMWSSNGTTSIKLAESDPFEVNAVAQAPYIDPNGYYIVGNIDEWKCVKVDEWHLVNNGGDVYENPIFNYMLPAVEGIETYEIKFIPAADFKEDGNINTWDRALSAPKDVDEVAYSGMFSYDNSGGNIKFEAEEGALYYDITLDLLNGTYNVAPVSFESFIYVPGNGQGWAPDKAAGLYSANNDGIYTGYAYIDGDFKFTKHRNWNDGEYNWENFTTVPAGWTQGGGTNINCPEAGVFYLTVDVPNLTIEATKIEYMGVTGEYCGWNEGAEMTWNVDDCCYELSNAAVTANGWKFRANGLTDSTWAINLGGNDSVEPSNNIGDLVGGGKNLGVVGSTIKLYPLRNTSDKIYCTVE